MLKVGQLVDYLKKVETPAEKFAQLKRFKREDDQIKRIDVPADGSCLFWAVALAYLAPVKDNNAEFRQRYEALFGDEQNLDHVRGLIQNYSPLSGRVPNDGILTNLVTSTFRNRIVDYMEHNPNDFNDNQFPDYDGPDTSFQDHLDGMKNSNTWGGSPEVVAMSMILDTGISITSGGNQHKFNDQNGIQIRLFYVNFASPNKLGNHYNFGLEQSVIDTFPRTGSRPETPAAPEGSNTGQEKIDQERRTKPELIELLLTEPINPNNRYNPIEPDNREKPIGFGEKFSLLLDETPNIGSTTKPEFFIHSILGSILTLPDSGLKLGIEKVYVKHAENTVKVCFLVKKDGKKQIALRVFTNDEGHEHSDSELKEIAEKLGVFEIDNIDEYVFRISSEGERGNKSFKLYRTQVRGVQEKFKTAVSSSLSQPNEFKEVDLTQVVDLKSKFEKLSDDKIEEVQDGTEEVFKEFVKVYKRNQKKLSLSTTEAAQHGFVYGALRLIFKYRYGLDCYVERIAGNGRADLILISRTKDSNGNIKPKPIPVIVEFKTGDHSADEAIAQIRNKGYTSNLTIRTKAEQAVIAGVNLAKEGQLQIEQEPIFQSQGFIRQLLQEVKDFNLDNIDEIKDNLKKELKNLYHSIQSHHVHYLSKLILGQIAATDGNGLKKCIFTYTNTDKGVGERATTFILSDKDEKALILNIIEKSDEQRGTRSGQKEFDNNKIPPINDLKIKSAVKIDIEIKTGVQHKPDGFEVERKEQSYFQSINVEEISNVRSKAKYQGKIKEIENISISNLIKELEIVRDQDSELTKLKNFLFQFKDSIRLELGLQALVQGIFINQGTESEQDIKVYIESNASKGRMDLTLSFTRLHKEYIWVIEFKKIKADVNKQAGKEKVIKVLDGAQKQLSQKYCFLKSLTDSREVNHIAIVFNSAAKDKKDIIKMEIKDKVKVPHTSQSGSSPEKPSRKRKAPDACGGPPGKRPRSKRDTGNSVCLLDVDEDNKVDKEKTGIDINYDKFDESKIDNEKLKIYRRGIEGQEKINQLNELIIEIQQAQALKNFYELSKEIDEKLLTALQNMDEILTENKNYFEQICKINLLKTILPLIADADLEELLLNNPEKLAQNQDLLNEIFTDIKEVISEKYEQQKLLYEDFKSLEDQIDEKISEKSEEIENIVNQDVNKSTLSNYVFKSIGLSLMSLNIEISIDLQKKVNYDALVSLGTLIHDHENHIKANHHGHENNPHIDNLKNRVKKSRLLAIAHDLYKLHKNIGDVSQNELDSSKIKNEITMYGNVDSEYKLNDIYNRFDAQGIKGYFSDDELKKFSAEFQAYDKEVLTIHSGQVFTRDELDGDLIIAVNYDSSSFDYTKVYAVVRDNEGDIEHIVIGDIADIKNSDNFSMDKETLEIKLKVGDESYIITSEVVGESTKFYLNIGGYKVKIGDLISSFANEVKSNVHNILNTLNDKVLLLQDKKAIEETAELLDLNQDNRINDIKQEFLKLGIREETLNQLNEQLESMNKEVYTKYVDEVGENLIENNIEFDRDKFNLAKVKGAKGGKFFSLMAIYDLFDSVNDVSTLRRHDNDALKQIFGINGILDAINDVRESLSTQYMRSDGNKGVRLSRNGLGKITSKIPADIRKSFVRMINNPIVQGITFATIAYQFGYSINEIAQGNHHPLNYYWTTSSGIKLANMSIRPASIGISFAMKGGSITSNVLRGLSIASKVLSKLAVVTMVADVLITIGVEIYERMEYTKAIAAQVPLLPGDEQAEVFFAKAIKFFTGRDVEKEYEDKIRIKSYLNYIKDKAIKLLSSDGVAAVVWFMPRIEEKYDEVIKGVPIKDHPPCILSNCPMMVVWLCELEEEYNNFSFKNIDAISDVKSSLSSINISEALPMMLHSLSMSEGSEVFIRAIKGKNIVESYIEVNYEKVYIINTDAKHIPHLTRYEYEDLRLRIISAPSGRLMKKEQCGKVVNRLHKGGNSNYPCNTNRVYRNCQRTFTLSGEPFILSNATRSSFGSIIYLLGPNQLVAAENYPAIMYVPEGNVDYTGSQNHDNVFIINSNTKGILVGGTANNVVVMNYNATNHIDVDLSAGIINWEGSKIELTDIYNYTSNSMAHQDISDHCKTKYLDVRSNGKGNTIWISDNICQDGDSVLIKVNKGNYHYRGRKQAIFMVDSDIGSIGMGYRSNFNLKNNTDIIYFNNTDISQFKINEQQAGYSLEFLADDKQNTVTNVKIDSFEKLVIQVKRVMIAVQSKSLFDIVKDMEYQRLNYLGSDIDSKIIEDSKKKSKAVIFADITDLKGLTVHTVYEVAKDIISSDSLGIPISLVQAKGIVNDVVYEAIIGSIYTSEVATDFNCESIDCKKVVMIEVNSYSSDYVVKFPQAYERNRSVDFILEVVIVPYAGTSDRVINLSDGDINPEDIECVASFKPGDVHILINQRSFRIVLHDYLWDPKRQYIVFQFNKGSEFYGVNSANLKFEPVLYNYEKKVMVDYDSFKYYKPDEQGLRIYHNQPKNENKVGFIDLKDWSILDCDMKIIDGDLILLHNDTTFIEMKNWSTCQPARKVIFAFNDTILKCIASDCELEDKFNKKKIALSLEKEIFDAIDQDSMDEAEDLAGRIKSTDVEKLTSFYRECASIKCQGHDYLHLAAKECKWNVVKFLIDKGVDIMATDEHGKIPFYYAVENGCAEVIDFMWEKAGSLIQDEIMEALGSKILEPAAKNGRIDILDSLWRKTESLLVKYKMLSANSYEAFRSAAKNAHVDILDYLWREAKSLWVMGNMLSANNYEVFRSAATNGHVDTLDSLWEKAGSLGVQYEMLKVGDYEALAHIIASHKCAYFLERFRSVIDIDKESMIFSPYIKGIAAQGWKKCLEAIAHDNNEEMLGWVWQNFILPLRLDVKQEISEFYPEFKQKSTEAGGSPKRAEESVQEKEKPVQRKRRHNHGDHYRHHNHLSRKPLAIDLDNRPEMVEGSANQEFSRIDSDSSAMESTSGVSKPFSWVNVFANALVGTVKGASQFILSPFKPAIDEEHSQTSKTMTTQSIDTNGILLLLDVFIRKITGQKYISTVDQSISQPEALGYALNIAKGFEKVVEQAALKNSISMHQLNIDFMEVQKEVTRKIISGKFDEISEVLNSYVEKACPSREAGCPGKLSPKKFDKFIDEFNNKLDIALNQSILQILQRGNSLSSKANRIEEQQKSFNLEDKPTSRFNNVSVHNNLTQVRNVM